MKPGIEIALAGTPQRLPAVARRYSVALVALFGIAALFFITVAAPYLLFEGRLMAIYETRKLGLWLHVALGSIALLAGPWQLWLGLGRRTGAWHRGLGRIYVAAVAGSVLAAVHLAVNTPLGPVFAAGALGLALAWTTTTGVAVYAVLKRDFEQHRQWMMRSYLVTLAFVLFRLFDPLLEHVGMSQAVERATLSIWLIWSVPLLVFECCLHLRRIGNHGQATAAP